MNRLLLFFIFVVLLSLACVIPAGNAPAIPQDQNAASGSILFQDDFSQPITGWDRYQVNGGIMDYDGGGYRFLVNDLNTNFWSTPHKNYADVRLEVDTGKMAGPDENRIGLICRYSGKDYYFFLISSDGYYGIGIFKDGQAILLGQSEMQASTSINKGLAINHLRADCASDKLALYVNGFETASVQDATLKAGDVGMLAGTFGEPGVDVVFDNFVALKP